MKRLDLVALLLVAVLLGAAGCVAREKPKDAPTPPDVKTPPSSSQQLGG